MKKKISTSVVGLQHHGVTVQVVERIKEGAHLSLKAEPDNTHDKYAVAVYVQNIKIGYIRAREARQVSGAIKAKATVTLMHCSDDTPSRVGYFSAKVIVESDIKTSPPQIAAPKTAGIYRIYSTNTGEFYIGQSVDVSARIREHWGELALGIHPNSALQELWADYGESNFMADLVAAAPEGLSSIDRQRWLADSEEYYISQGKKYGECLNKYPGGLVLTQELRDLEDEQERRGRLLGNDAIRARHQEVKQELSIIADKLEKLTDAYQTSLAHISRINNIITNKTGLRSIFYGRMESWEKKSNERELSSQQFFSSRMRAEIEELNKKQTDLISELGTLKPKSFKIQRK